MRRWVGGLEGQGTVHEALGVVPHVTEGDFLKEDA